MGTWNLVRHGETVWNRDGRIQGHRHVPLTERGRAQARQLAERLDGQGADVMYSSDLGHALATAQALAAASGVAIRAEANLREFSYGAWEGLTLEEAKAHDPAIFAARITGRNSDVAAPDGETTFDLLERVRRFTDAARRRHSKDENVTIVGHGGTLRAVAVCLLGLGEEHFWRLRLSHGSLSVVTVLADTCVLELWNDTSHLVDTQSRTIP